MKNLISQTIEKIKKQGIAPEPRWKFLVKKYGVWILFSVIVIFGALSFSTAYYTLSSLDWDLYRFMHQNRLSYTLSIFPYFWTILIGIFLIGAFFDIRKTETGYRFSLLKISLIIVGGILVLGLMMSFVGLGSRFHLMMNENVPYYGQHMMVTKEAQWNNPTEGFLAGTITSFSENELKINDLQDRKWNIELKKETFIRPRAEMVVGQMIKIIGVKKSEDSFEANEIRPWAGMGQGMMQGQSNRGGMMRGN